MSDQTHMKRGFLKDKLGSYKVDPPEQVWNEINGRIGSRRSRRRAILLFLVSAASLALAISLGIHYFGPDLPKDITLSESSPEEREIPQVNPGGDQEGPLKGSKLEQKVIENMAELREGSEVPQDRGEKYSDLKEQAEKTGVAVDLQQEEIMEVEDQPSGGIDQESERFAATTRPQESDSLQRSDSLKEALSLPEQLSDTAVELNAEATPLMEDLPGRRSTWVLGASLSPLYSYRDADAAVPDNAAESGLLSYSTGVHISYRRNSRFAFETGIYFNKTGIAIGAPGIKVYSQNFDNMVFGTGSEKAEIRTVSNSVGNIIAYSGDIYMNGYKINAENGAQADASAVLDEIFTDESGIQQHLDFLELPFNVRYSVIDRTFELQLVGGMSTNFLVNNYVTMKTSSGQEEIGYLSNLKTINYSGNAGLGMVYHMGRKLSLTLEPRFRYFINSVNDSSLPSTRPYSLGLYTGFSYTF